MLGWGLMWTDIYTPWELKDRLPSPLLSSDLLSISTSLPVAERRPTLWYRGWNEPILNYYRIENDYLPPANFPSWQHRDAIWSMS